MFANLFSLVIVICWVAGVHLMDPGNKLRKAELVGLLLLLLYSNYRRFMQHGDADDLIRKFEQQKRRETQHGEIRLLWYVLGSVAAPFVLGLIGLTFHLH